MGISRYSGPVYGAKSNLFSFGPFTGSGASTATIVALVVPAYETWFVTEMQISNPQATSNSSTPKVILKAKGTSTSVSYPGPGPDPQYPTGHAGTVVSITGPTSTAGFNLIGAPTADAGEYEGYGVPANSTLRVVSSGTIGQLYVAVHGFRRYLDSTRAV